MTLILAISIGALALGNVAALGLVGWLVYLRDRRSTASEQSVLGLAEEAFGHLTSKSLGEVQAAKAQKAAANAQLSYLADTLAKSESNKAEKAKATKAEPNYATTTSGERINLNEYEFLDI